MSWLQIKKISVLKCLFLFYATTISHILIRLGYVMQNGLHMTTSDDQLSEWTKKKLQSSFQNQTCTKKWSWALFGGFLPVWSSTAFWIAAKPVHLRSILGKLMRCTKNCHAPGQHWSTERSQFSTAMPNNTSHNQCFKSWINWATKFCLIHHIHLNCHQLTTSSSSILTTFCRQNVFTTRRTRKMLSKSSSNPEAWIFMLQE